MWWCCCSRNYQNWSMLVEGTFGAFFETHCKRGTNCFVKLCVNVSPENDECCTADCKFQSTSFICRHASDEDCFEMTKCSYLLSVTTFVCPVTPCVMPPLIWPLASSRYWLVLCRSPNIGGNVSAIRCAVRWPKKHANCRELTAHPKNVETWYVSLRYPLKVQGG